MTSASRYPDRYAYIDLYSIDGTVDQEPDPNFHPTAAGYLTRAAYIWANAALTPPLSGRPQTSAGSCP